MGYEAAPREIGLAVTNWLRTTFAKLVGGYKYIEQMTLAEGTRLTNLRTLPKDASPHAYENFGKSDVLVIGDLELSFTVSLVNLMREQGPLKSVCVANPDSRARVETSTTGRANLQTLEKCENVRVVNGINLQTMVSLYLSFAYFPLCKDTCIHNFRCFF